MTDNVITDAELVRYLDGEVTGEARTAMAARLANEPESAARLAVLQQRTTTLSRLLVEVDPAELEVRRSAHVMKPQVTQAARASMPTLMKAAAAIVLLFGLAFAVPPVRAWIVDQVMNVAQAIGWVAPESGPLPAPTAAPTVS
ncbi:MAG: hypothetical protein ACRENP_30175, partial [Longimicrobiales bacterium]